MCAFYNRYGSNKREESKVNLPNTNAYDDLATPT